MSVRGSSDNLSTTGSLTGSLPPGKTFWDPGMYMECIKRGNSSNQQLTNFKLMLEDRASIENKYADHLSKWAREWRKNSEKGPEEASFKTAWKSFCDEADSLAQLHLDIKKNLLELCKRVAEWQHQSFKKSHRLKELEKGFKHAQQPWADHLKKLEERRKKYYSACKEKHGVELQIQQGQLDNSSEQQKKLNNKLNKAENDVHRARQKYETALNELAGDKNRYQRDMNHHFNCAQDFEKERLDFLLDTMGEASMRINVATTEGYPEIYLNLQRVLNSTSSNDDLIAFARTKGPEAPFYLPVFNEWTPEMRSSKLETMKVEVDPVTTIQAIRYTPKVDEATGAGRPSLRQPNSTLPAPPAHDQSSKPPIPTTRTVKPQRDPEPPPPPAKSMPDYSGTLLGPENPFSTDSLPRDDEELDEDNPFSSDTLPRDEESTPFDEVDEKPTAATEPGNPFGDENDYDSLSGRSLENGDAASPAADGYEELSPPPVMPRGAPPPPYSEQGAARAPPTGTFTVAECDAAAAVDQEDGADHIYSQTDRAAAKLENEAAKSESGSSNISMEQAPNHNSEHASHNGQHGSSGTAEVDESRVQYRPGVQVQALYSYEADDDDEISLHEGDQFVKLSDADENGWSYGMCRGRYGLYPATYAQPI